MVYSSFYSESEKDYDGLKTHFIFFPSVKSIPRVFSTIQADKILQKRIYTRKKIFLNTQTRVKKSSRIKTEKRASFAYECD
jgi:hypothetical protein